MPSWTSLVIDELCELKQMGGMSFDEAWAEVVRAHPPRGLRPSDGYVPFLRKVARDAWEDRQPALRAFPTMLDRVS